MYKLHHVGLFCESMPESLAFYQTVLHHQMCHRFFKEGGYNYSFLHAGGDLLLELMAAPFAESEQQFIAEHGYTLHHLALAVPDLNASYDQLMAAGLRVAWEPDDFLFVRHFGVYDDCGNVVEILQENEPLPVPDATYAFPYHLQHVCLLSDDWERTASFYSEHFGLHTPFPAVTDHGRKAIYLADQAYNPFSHNCLIKVLGSPLQTEEGVESAETLPKLDHNAYVVVDVESAFKNAVDAGAKAVYEPYSNDETMLAWIEDVDGNDLVLMA